MKSLSLQDFVIEGTLNDITLGASLGDVEKALGEPPIVKKRTTGIRKRGEHLWTYGSFDFFFHKQKLVKVTSFCHPSDEITLGESLFLDLWIIKPGMAADTLRNQLIASNVSFEEPELAPHGWAIGTVFLCSSGVRLACRDDGLDMLGLSEDRLLPVGLV